MFCDTVSPEPKRVPEKSRHRINTNGWKEERKGGRKKGREEGRGSDTNS